MSEVSLLQSIAATLAGPVGTFFLIVLMGFGLATKRLVPGWVFEQCLAAEKKCTEELAARVAKSEADLDQLRRDRMTKGG